MFVLWVFRLSVPIRLAWNLMCVARWSCVPHLLPLPPESWDYRHSTTFNPVLQKSLRVLHTVHVCALSYMLMHTMVDLWRSEGSFQESAPSHVGWESLSRYSWWKTPSATETGRQVSCVSTPPTWRWHLLWYPSYRRRVICPRSPSAQAFLSGSTAGLAVLSAGALRCLSPNR